MSLIPWEPLKELNTLRQQMNRLFDEIIHPEQTHGIFPKLEKLSWHPAIELKEADKDIIVKVQVPGIDAKDLDIQVSENAVAVTGEYQEEKTSDSKGFYRSEFSYGKFQRIIPLPVNVKHEEVKAEVKDGVVTLTLPKAEISQRHAVKVNLTVQEKARGAMTEERLHGEHLQETMQERATEELDRSTTSYVAEEARNAMTEKRQHEEHLEDTMHTRAASEFGVDATKG
ncbi:Hsp20/alpha crystallin family protein [Calothrix sp. UHCC 0171]|uniref:Hsp20/alpha crystallin family protein n=1 Tax=Calothrix sp. UHCC 0171 TaxID=3110245 RepID=UPI002B1EF548|nr:Hsp20/alpha crystallin family protein [Calothrix sp. UHCC 0171]MEA5571126.1 Hsp20/alpha crystallin family protein [Calothrix sp. UHCC 0171]